MNYLYLYELYIFIDFYFRTEIIVLRLYMN